MHIYLVIASLLHATTPFITAPPQEFAIQTPSSLLVQTLTTLGTPLEDISSFSVSGIPTPAILKLFTHYALHANDSAYTGLSSLQRGSLILFGYELLAQNQIPASTISTLMEEEKNRAGLSSQEIDTLHQLVQKIEQAPSYTLTSPDVSFVRSLLPALSQVPFAFADSIGALIQAFVIQEDNPAYPLEDDDIEKTLSQAAKEISQLSDKQVENITMITQTYHNTEQFDASQENVEDINAALALAALPMGTYALYPLIGSDAVYDINTITRTYPHNFPRATRYQTQVGTAPRAERHAAKNQNRPAARQKSLDRSTKKERSKEKGKRAGRSSGRAKGGARR